MPVVHLSRKHFILVDACVVVGESGNIYIFFDRTIPWDFHDQYPLTSAHSRMIPWGTRSMFVEPTDPMFPATVEVHFRLSREIYTFSMIGGGPSKITRLQCFARKVLLETRIRRRITRARKTALACALHPRLGRESPLAILSTEELALVGRFM
jgi:hypothetical protein